MREKIKADSQEFTRSDVYHGVGPTDILNRVNLNVASKLSKIGLSDMQIEQVLKGGLGFSNAKVAMALYDNGGPNLSNTKAAKVAKVLHDKDGLNLNYAEVAKALKEGLGLSNAQVARALCDKDGLNLNYAEVAQALKDGLDLNYAEVAQALKDGLDLNYAEVKRALKDGLGLSDKQVEQAAGFKVGPVSINVALTGTSHELRQDTRRTR